MSDGKPVFGAIADDLTGGMELASMLVKQGVDCRFVTKAAAIARSRGAGAVVAGLRTRVIAPEAAVEAFRAAADALRGIGARQLFFKYCATFDSTDRGNIGPCADLLAEMTGAPFVAFCPSLPEVGRTVYQGHLFYGDRLISESPKRHDPLTPMTDPDLVRVLQRQTSVRVGLLPHGAVTAGQEALKKKVEELAGMRVRYAIADAIYPQDLQTIARLTVDWPLMTGNSSVAEYYPALWHEKGLIEAAAPEPLPSIGGHAAVLAGSCAERTLEQLAAFARHRPVHYIDLIDAIDGKDVVGNALSWTKEHLASGPVALATSAGPAEVEAIQGRIGREAAGRLAEQILGSLAQELLRLSVRRFVVAGGETSGAIIDELGIEELGVGPYGGPGISRAVSAGPEPIALCLKSGKLGPVDMFLPMLAEMSKKAG